MSMPQVELLVAPMNGKPQRIVEARAGSVVYRDTIDTNSAMSRQRFIGNLARKLAVEAGALVQVDDELVRQADAADAAAEQAAQQAAARAEPSAATGDASELDAARIARPEQFIASEVAGLSVPIVESMNGEPAVRWQLYLRWADGKRQRRGLERSVELATGDKLLIHPLPVVPSVGDAQKLCGWSSSARRAWLQGAATPSAADVFARLCARIAYYVELPPDTGPGTTATLALWSMLTYCYSAWPAVPYLYFGGPAGSGKSRIFEVLGQIVFRPLMSSNMTAAALFRTIHERGGTLLLDEAERLRQASDPGSSELLSILLAGYKRGGTAMRLEPVGDTFRNVAFDVYGPKALACIAGLPPALASRCIRVTMFRAPPASDKPRRRVDADAATWQQLRDDLHALTLEHGATMLELANRADVCPAMSGRNYELWQPILALASWIETAGANGLAKLVEGHALATIDAARDDSTPDADAILLQALADALRHGERPQAKDVLDSAKQADGELFKQWTAAGVARALKRYGIETKTIHGRKVYMPAMLDVLRRVQNSYGIDLGLGDPSPEGTPKPTQGHPEGQSGLV